MVDVEAVQAGKKGVLLRLEVVSSEWRVLIVGKDVREHGLTVTPHYWLAKERRTALSLK